MYQLPIVFIIFKSTLFATETELKKTSIFIESHFCNEDFIKWRKVKKLVSHQAPH